MLIQGSEIVLRGGVALVGGGGVKCHRLAEILPDPFSVFVQKAQPKFGVGRALGRSLLVPSGCFLVVLGNVGAGHISLAHQIFRLRVSAQGFLLQRREVSLSRFSARPGRTAGLAVHNRPSNRRTKLPPAT